MQIGCMVMTDVLQISGVACARARKAEPYKVYTVKYGVLEIGRRASPALISYMA